MVIQWCIIFSIHLIIEMRKILVFPIRTMYTYNNLQVSSAIVDELFRFEFQIYSNSQRFGSPVFLPSFVNIQFQRTTNREKKKTISQRYLYQFVTFTRCPIRQWFWFSIQNWNKFFFSSLLKMIPFGVWNVELKLVNWNWNGQRMISFCLYVAFLPCFGRLFTFAGKFISRWKKKTHFHAYFLFQKHTNFELKFVANRPSTLNIEQNGKSSREMCCFCLVRFLLCTCVREPRTIR